MKTLAQVVISFKEYEVTRMSHVSILNDAIQQHKETSMFEGEAFSSKSEYTTSLDTTKRDFNTELKRRDRVTPKDLREWSVHLAV